jgi:hypothetical protein
MGLLDALAPSAVSVGNDAGWLLGFHRETSSGRARTIVDQPVLEIGRDDYEGDIRASLPEGLAGGTYTFTIEGITDADYRSIAQTGENAPTVVKLYLYWRDTTSSPGAYLASIAGVGGKLKGSDISGGPVAVLSIVSVTRKVGERRYQAEVTARERVFALLDGSRLCDEGASVDSPSDATSQVVDPVLGNSNYHDPSPHPEVPPPQPENAGDGAIHLEQRETAVQQLTRIAQALEERSGRYGRGMLLIRQGDLHVGMRDIPLEGDAKPLTVAGGLVEPTVTGLMVADPTHDPCDGGFPQSRRQFQIVLKGRPDLFPGDTVQINLPDEDVSTTGGGLLGAIGDLASSSLLPSASDTLTDPKTTIYVNGVEHRLGRTSGFVTTLTGVELQDGVDPWDPREYPHGILGSKQSSPHPNAETDAGRAVSESIETAATRRTAIDVGEVRETNNSGSSEPPSQTELVWQGLEPSDGDHSQARRLAVSRPTPLPLRGVPYATPWAWGKCGLVLPRYPGTRVVLAHRHGRTDDAIDIGAVWESGHGPDSDPGDWWLILPVGVEQDQSLSDGDVPTEPSGNAVNDLTDKDGNRVIEVGELTVRVGANSLSSAGTRPARASDQGSITIEHADGGASIVVKSDGTITIHAAKNLELKSDADITMDAKNVKVTLSANGTMDVS